MFEIARQGLLRLIDVANTRVHRGGPYKWHVFDSEEGSHCPSLDWHRENKPYSYVSFQHYPIGRCGEPEEFTIEFPCYLTDEHWLLVKIGKGHGGIYDSTLDGTDLSFTSLSDLNETVKEFLKELSKL